MPKYESYFEYNREKAKDLGDGIYMLLENLSVDVDNVGVFFRNTSKRWKKGNKRVAKMVEGWKKTNSKTMEDVVVEDKRKPEEVKGSTKTEDKKTEGFFAKLVKLYYSFLDKVKLGLHYLALALIMLAFISLVSFLISGGKFHVFIKSVSDIFESVFKFLKNVFYSVFKGVVTLSPAVLMNEMADHYEKMLKKLSEAFKKMKAAGINESAFAIVMGLSVGGFIVGHVYIQKELYGES